MPSSLTGGRGMESEGWGMPAGMHGDWCTATFGGAGISGPMYGQRLSHHIKQWLSFEFPSLLSGAKYDFSMLLR